MENSFGIDLSNEEAHDITSVDKAINTFFKHMNSRIANKMVETPKVQTQLHKWWFYYSSYFAYLFEQKDWPKKWRKTKKGKIKIYIWMQSILS